MKEFNFYDITAVIAPGMVLIIGVVLLFFPGQQDVLEKVSKISVGSLGVGVILAYVVGQLLQAVGNGLEAVWWWFWGGMPTDWVRSNNHPVLSPQQRDRLQDRVRVALGSPSMELVSCASHDWYSVTRQIYAAVSGAGRSARVDAFNGNYGLCRGVAASLVSLLVATAIVDWRSWRVELTLILLISLAVFRMHRFAVRYGRELFVQYLQLPENPRADGGKA